MFGTVKDEWCTTVMLNKLAQHPEWYKGNLIKRDPFELLRLIKKYMYMEEEAHQRSVEVSHRYHKPSDTVGR